VDLRIEILVAKDQRAMTLDPLCRNPKRARVPDVQQSGRRRR
jgi:hypothetical protein